MMNICITDITPTDTPCIPPFVSQKRTGARIVEWMEDQPANCRRTTRKLKAIRLRLPRLSPTTLRTNSTQIMSNAFEVSATADAVGTYGRAKI